MKLNKVKSDMNLTVEKKRELFKKFGKDENDSGATEAQIALFTERISHLTQHLKTNRKDFGTQRALLAMVGKRRSLLDYLKKKDIEKYRSLIKELKIRK
ncbi:30S ribosomal protein S15 [Salinivirga cyanobacteriivorans]|uniref:Small ribosomal subunit protein uS15 n=2 Tax=Salinivirgaceae TaxID=1970190 RepID=A0A0S2I1Z4_9BACT|nr:30S ribosomal protein S15 [Salinivirga cyanobacteriivorans]